MPKSNIFMLAKYLKKHLHKNSTYISKNAFEKFILSCGYSVQSSPVLFELLGQMHPSSTQKKLRFFLSSRELYFTG